MTEPEWLACNDVEPMLDWVSKAYANESRPLAREAGARKMRLFSVACCRRIWHLLLWDERCWKAVEVAEQYADGHRSAEELQAAQQAAHEATQSARGFAADAGTAAYVAAGRDWVNARYVAHSAARAGDGRMEAAAQVRLLRCIFSPFRPLIIDPAWVSPVVLSVARVIYDERRFEELPILADALEEAGCPDNPLIHHLRAPWPSCPWLPGP